MYQKTNHNYNCLFNYWIYSKNGKKPKAYKKSQKGGCQTDGSRVCLSFQWQLYIDSANTGAYKKKRDVEEYVYSRLQNWILNEWRVWHTIIYVARAWNRVTLACRRLFSRIHACFFFILYYVSRFRVLFFTATASSIPCLDIPMWNWSRK